VKFSRLKLFDMRDERNLKTVGLDRTLLLKDDANAYPQCTAIANNLRKQGYDGIIYPSVRNKPEGTCLVLFLENASKKTRVNFVEEAWWNARVKSGLV